MNPEQLKGEHGTLKTKMVNGVRVNADHVEDDTKKASKKVAEKEADKVDFSDMTKSDLVEELEKRGVEHDPKATKAELLALLEK